MSILFISDKTKALIQPPKNVDDALDITKKCIVTKCLQLEQIGHPNAPMFSYIMGVIERNFFQLPREQLVLADGASVLISPTNGVISILRQKLANPKLFAQHCCPHRLVLAAKARQQHIPDYI